MLHNWFHKTLLAGSTLALVLVGNASGALAQTQAPTQAAQLSGTITILNHRTDLDQDGTLAKYSAEFQKLYPGVTVKWQTYTNYAGDVATRMSTKDYGDILNIPPSITADKFPDFFTVLGTVSDLGQKYNFINAATFNGSVYGLATTGNANGLLYNKDVFKAAGITTLPTTPDEFQADLKLIKDKTKAIPLYTNYHAGWPLTSWNSGIEPITGDADYVNLKLPHLDAPFAKDQPLYLSYKMLYDAVKAGYTEKDPTTTDWEKSKTMVATGQIGVMNLGSWAIVQMQQAATAAGVDPSVIGYMPYPFVVNGKQYAQAGPDYAMAINKNSPNQDIDKAFVTWFIEQSNFAFDQGGIPTLKSAKLPADYDAFSAAGVVLVVDTPAKTGEEGLVNNIDKQSFDDIMNAANTAWAAARQSLKVTP